MAYIGLANPYIAKLKDEATKEYEDGFKCGKAMNVSVTPNYNEAKLYADNQLAEYVREFKDGTMALGTDRLPSEALVTMFGHTVSSSDNTVTYKTGDAANYVGVGFYVDEMKDGVKTYTATIIYKVKFSEAAESYTTKGDSIEFQTPSLEGTIAGLASGEWKLVKSFTTEAEADEFIKTTLGIVTP